MWSRRIGRMEKEDNVIISTVQPAALAWYGNYETAISFDGGREWRIAEGYDSEDEAENGHKKYCAMSNDELANLNFID